MRRTLISASSKHDKLHKYDGKVGIVNDKMVDGEGEVVLPDNYNFPEGVEYEL